MLNFTVKNSVRNSNNTTRNINKHGDSHRSFPQQSTVKLLMVYPYMQTNLWLTLSNFEFWFKMTYSYRAIFYKHTMIAPWECTMVAMQPFMHFHVTSIGATSPSMSGTGLDSVLIVFNLNPHSLPMDLCKSVCTSICFTPLVDYVDPLPASPAGNKWILTAVCPLSNYLRAIPIPDKTAPTAALALFQDILLFFGFSIVLQSDRGGEWMNALLHRLVTLLSIKQVFTSGFRPRMNGATERTHQFLDAALGIYCEKHQEKCEEYLQSAVYAHNTSLISGLTSISPFFWCLVGILLPPETLCF